MESLDSFKDTDNCELRSSQEPLSKYQKGGFHPLCLGETLRDERYTVKHKLGWGGFSTVWLAWDNQEEKYVAVKILTADSPASIEAQHLKGLDQASNEGLDEVFIVELFDTFELEGPNGKHQCLIFEVLGPSLAVVLESYSLTSKEVLKATKQLLHAVSFIHENGYGHGDISIRNIAYTLPQVPTFNLMDHLDQPQVHDLVLKSGEGLPPGFPTQIVKAAEWKTQDIFDEADIRLLDFGDTFEQGHEPDHLAQPNSLRAPETILTDGFDFKVDLWDVGVTIYEIIFRDPPFMYLGDEEGFIASMLAFIGGEMPKEWDEVYREIHRKGGREWEVFENVPESKPGLERKFESLEDKSLKPLLAILQGLMKFNPEDRILASEALKKIFDIETVH
ncbi:Protein kinase-like (PK-like) [Glarea lozoyensis ATCC 20868]|uniref:Protein kinase-like (PK-like) n=1 Tax=Glarea lozoyensis (strain ATCC 20868 / MF5171) TaxID=1116229 RepID=S3CKL6_GLAL2|nr:Protein kinase-like (PK-like) [Glarea lozoyensis ATCC 20868]EPE25744.1 Protein kinase-like (PK-like) [Glarea lozoyensis ATCC 20868]